MGGSNDAFALYLSLFRVDRPTDAAKATTSLSYHKEAETKFEYGTGTLKANDPAPKQEGLLSHEELKAQIEKEVQANRVDLPTEDIPANPTARNGQRLGGGEEEEAQELTLGQRREMAVRAAEKRAENQREALSAGEGEVRSRARPAA